MKRTAKIRIGVSGLGRIGWPFHCAEIARHPAFEFVAVQDPEPDRRAEAERVYGARSFARFDDMLAEGRLDAVAIAADGRIFFTDATRRLSPRERGTFEAALLDVLEHSCTGRVLLYDPADRRVAPVIDGLTGVQRGLFGGAQVWRTKSREAEAEQASEGIPLWYGWGAGPVYWPAGPIVRPPVTPSRPMSAGTTARPRSEMPAR